MIIINDIKEFTEMPLAKIARNLSGTVDKVTIIVTFCH